MLREAIGEHLQVTLPEPPERIKVIEIDNIRLESQVDVISHLKESKPVMSSSLSISKHSVKEMDMYSTHVTSTNLKTAY